MYASSEIRRSVSSSSVASSSCLIFASRSLISSASRRACSAISARRLFSASLAAASASAFCFTSWSSSSARRFSASSSSSAFAFRWASCSSATRLASASAAAAIAAAAGAALLAGVLTPFLAFDHGIAAGTDAPDDPRGSRAGGRRRTGGRGQTLLVRSGATQTLCFGGRDRARLLMRLSDSRTSRQVF